MTNKTPSTPSYWTHEVCEITPTLFLSGALPRDLHEALIVLDAWRAAGITDYVDVRVESDATEFFAAHAPDIRYWRAPADDHLGLQDHSWWTQANELIHAAFARGGKCMVKCAIGVNRSPSIVFSTLLTLGWEVEAALTQGTTGGGGTVCGPSSGLACTHPGQVANRGCIVATSGAAMAPAEPDRRTTHHQINPQSIGILRSTHVEL